MKCKFCQAELEEENSICPVCGKDNALPAEESNPVEKAAKPVKKEKVKLSAGKLAVSIVVCVVLLAALVVGIMVVGKDSFSFGDNSTQVVEGTIPKDGNENDETCKGSYTASDNKVKKANQTVVATMDEHALTNGELQIYYWMQIYTFANNYSSYFGSFGLDMTLPLDQQVSPHGNTWQQQFLAMALNSWQQNRSMSDLAQKEGIALSEEKEAEMDELLSTMDQQATDGGFESVDEMLAHNFGPGCTAADYENYVRDYYLSSEYYDAKVADLNPTDEEIEAYFDENSAGYAEMGLEKTTKTVNVRHILIAPKKAEGSDEISESAWKACQSLAQGILDDWAEGEKTEASFAALANEHSTDGGSNTNGGLYENVCVGDMVEEFNDWCFDEVRKVGDTGLVKTKFGYHIMYFSGESFIWPDTAKSDLLYELEAEVVDEAIAQYTTEINYNEILLGFIDFSAEG